MVIAAHGCNAFARSGEEKGPAGLWQARRPVHDVTYNLVRSLGLTTVFADPGSTEQTFSQNSPDGFTSASVSVSTAEGKAAR